MNERLPVTLLGTVLTVALVAPVIEGGQSVLLWFGVSTLVMACMWLYSKPFVAFFELEGTGQ